MDTGLPKKSLERLARNCQRARERVAISAEDAAAAVEMSSGYIYQMERAGFNPPLAILLRLSKLYKVKLTDLVRGVTA